ncbi:MAG: hypothetical protein L6Q84_05570 [Polyangiaceae bacterium]|nr:hypothetical protein [Polyangiaceae bacterium]
MTKNISNLLLAAAPALLFCLGCTGAVERDDRGPGTVSGPPAATAEPSATPAPSHRGRGTGPQLGRGSLVPTGGEDDPATRESICVSVGADGNIDRIDEVSCTLATEMHECAPNDCPWIRCGDCLIHVDRPSDYLDDPTGRSGPPWLLNATWGAGTCTAFAGTYEVYADATCRVRSAM